MLFIKIGNDFYVKTSNIRSIYLQDDDVTSIYVDYDDGDNTDEICFNTKEERDIAWHEVQIEMLRYRMPAAKLEEV